jgi:hypothetical protein
VVALTLTEKDMKGSERPFKWVFKGVLRRLRLAGGTMKMIFEGKS